MGLTRISTLAAAGVIAVAGLAACAKDDNAGAATGDGRITVAATDTACQVSTTETRAGTVTFTVTNKGSKVTEFYVYAKDGSIKGEVENISPGVTRDLSVELTAGEYEGACKPGQKGDGIRTKLTVSGKGRALTADPRAVGRGALRPAASIGVRDMGCLLKSSWSGIRRWVLNRCGARW